MSVMSERDIVDEMIRGNIIFYPFIHENLRGCCLGLTASDFVYSIETQKLLDIQIDTHSNKFFEISPGETVLVFTNECIAINESYCGSIHSKVEIASRGIGHIGTKVNPGWSGILSLALHNTSHDRKIVIHVNEIIAYLRFSKMSSKTLSICGDHRSGRLDAFPGNVPQRLNEWIYDGRNSWRSGDKRALQQQLQASTGFQEAKRMRAQETASYRLKRIMKRWAAPLAVTVILLIYFHRNNKLSNELLIALLPIAYTLVSEYTKESR